MSQPAFADLKILVLDQNLNRARLIRDLLDNVGIGETFATTAADAASEWVRGGICTMALVDLVDVDENSSPVFFMAALRDPKRTSASGLPVLGMMAEVTKESLMGAVHIGADFVIQRPFSVKSLSDRVTSMIATPAPQFSSIDYIGPDRRRVPDGLYDGDQRRDSDDA